MIFGPVRAALRQGVIEDFNARATWEQVIGPHGWRFAKRVGQVDYWLAPPREGSRLLGHDELRRGRQVLRVLVVD